MTLEIKCSGDNLAPRGDSGHEDAALIFDPLLRPLLDRLPVRLDGDPGHRHRQLAEHVELLHLLGLRLRSLELLPLLLRDLVPPQPVLKRQS